MKESRIFEEGCIAAERKPEGFHQNTAVGSQPKGRIFQGWKRYEEAEEEE